MLGRVTSPAASAATIPGQPDLPPTPEAGLDDAEVARRRAAGLGNEPPPPTTRTYAQILRENVFTFVNNILFALGIALVLVGRPFDALVSLTVISTNVIVGIVQEIRAKRTLDRIALLTRPTATIVRSGATIEVRPEELVLGDLVVVMAGDQIVLDGRLVAGDIGVDESQLTGESDVVRKRVGDEVFSGSFATTGAGRYVVEAVASNSFANRITAGARSFRRVITPLQAEINLVIRVVLGIVLYLEVLLVVRGLVQRSVLGDVVADATLLAGLVPNGLFVSIAVAYALGAIRILRFGALVQQANSIESLSHVDVLCLDKTGTLTANRLEVEAVSGLGGATEDEVIAVLSALAASATVRNQTTQAIAARWPREGAGPGRRGAVLVGPQVERRGVRARRRRAARDHRARGPDLPAAVAGRGPRRPAGGMAGAGAGVRRLDRARAARAARGHLRRRGGPARPRGRGRGDAPRRDAGARARGHGR